MIMMAYLLNSIWQLPVLMLATWLLVQTVGRRDSRLRYHLWLSCLVLAVVLPTIPQPSIRSVSVAAVERPLQTVSKPAHTLPSSLPLDSPVSRYHAVEFALLLYCGVIVSGCIRLFLGWRRVGDLLKASSIVHLPNTVTSTYEAAAHHLSLTTPVIRSHAEINSPAVAGWSNPVILVSPSFSTWSAEDASAALCHELTHIARRDFAWNIVCRVLMLPLLYHPLSYWLRREIELSREMVCDEWAAELSTGRYKYAHSLLSMSRKSLRMQQGLTVGWYIKRPLEERIMQLIESQSRKPHSRWTSAVSVAALGGVALFLTLGSVVSAGAQSSKETITPPPTSSAPTAQADTSQGPLATAKGSHAHVSKTPGTYEHHWKAADGQTVVILNKSPEPPSAEERQRIEKTIRDTRFTLGDLPKLSGPSLDSHNLDDLQGKLDKAEVALNDPALQKEMDAMEKQFRKSEQALREAQKAFSLQQ